MNTSRNFKCKLIQVIINMNCHNLLKNKIPLVGPSTSGRTYYTRLSLNNQGKQFQEIVKSAHSVIVAGGTMRPMEEFRDQVRKLFLAPQTTFTFYSALLPISLFPNTSNHLFQLFIASGAPQSRVTTFSCDHVVPGSNLLPFVLPRLFTQHFLDKILC